MSENIQLSRSHTVCKEVCQVSGRLVVTSRLSVGEEMAIREQRQQIGDGKYVLLLFLGFVGCNTRLGVVCQAVDRLFVPLALVYFHHAHLYREDMTTEEMVWR